MIAYLGDSHDQVGGQERSPDHVVDPEPGGDVPDGSLRRGGGESEDRLDAEPLVEELADPEVSRTEVVRPGRDAVGLVNAHEGDGGQALDDLCVSKIFHFQTKSISRGQDVCMNIGKEMP